MKKDASKKLALHRETLRTLEQGSLRTVQGANSAETRCISECWPCDPELSTIP